jgi:hypothetical protein
VELEFLINYTARAFRPLCVSVVGRLAPAVLAVDFGPGVRADSLAKALFTDSFLAGSCAKLVTVGEHGYRERDTVICCRKKGLFCISVAAVFLCALSAKVTSLASGDAFDPAYAGGFWNHGNSGYLHRYVSATNRNDPQPKQKERVIADGICDRRALQEARNVT